MAAPFLAPVARPPHDPRTLVLDARLGWRVLADPALPSGVEVEAGSLGLALAAQPWSGRMLGEASGSFGGLVLPSHVALLPAGGLVLLDRARHTLKRMDACACAFVPWPCMGAKDARLPATVAAIACAFGELLLCDPGGNRIIVLDAATGAVRAVWNASVPAGGVPWTPTGAARWNRLVVVADPANGALHLLTRHGHHAGLVAGLGAVRSIAVDRHGRAYARRDGESEVLVVDLAARQVTGSALRPAEVASGFAPPSVAVAADGRIDIASLCEPPRAAPLWIDASGNEAAGADPGALPSYPAHGWWYGGPLDSELAGCVWDRVVLEGSAPPRTRVEVATRTSETPLSADELADEATWEVAGAWRDATGADLAPARVVADFMLHSPPGRYCWLRLRFVGAAHVTPCIDRIAVDFPRVSLARYMPAVFGAEPVAAEFTDRWLAIFDRTLRDIESGLDEQARLFDPLSAPAQPDVAASRDFLAFLAAWVGVTLARAWPLARRRAVLKGAPRLYAWRGTVRGLRSSLYLFLGLDRWIGYDPAPAACVPCPERDRVARRTAWRPPRLVLEHFHLRRWMTPGHARLSDAAKLWGENIVNRSRLESQTAILAGGATGGARLGVTQLKTSQDPARDPFHVYAHRMSLFVPAACARNVSIARALGQLVDAERPAHVEARLIFVEPRFRVGVQAMLGLDAVIGVRAAEARLDAGSLGKGTVLAATAGDGEVAAAPRHVGAVRVGMNTVLH